MSVTSALPSSGGQPPSSDPQGALLRLATGYRLSQMLHVVAKLGIADLLAAGPQECAQLARLSGAHAASLLRALRALAGVGIFFERPDGRFALTPNAEPLQSDVAGSVRDYVIMQGEDWIWDAWGRALHSVRTGEPAFNYLHATDIFTYLDRHPDAAATFNAGVTGRAASADVVVARAYDFGAARTIVDVGGGHGLLLSTILEEFPDAHGVLLDVPAVAAGALKRIAAAGLSLRCDGIGGDFFVSVPAGGDIYVLTNVIHDWDDERAGAILRNCHRAMTEGTRLLIVETVLPEGNDPHPGKVADLQMLVISGGRERTEAEYRVLLESNGFRPTRVLPTGSPVSIVEAVRNSRGRKATGS